MLPYQHTQVGYVILWVTAVIVALLAATLRLGAEREFWLALVFLALVVALFPSLTVKVDPQVIAIRFGAGPIRRRFPVSEIASVQAVKNP